MKNQHFPKKPKIILNPKTRPKKKKKTQLALDLKNNNKEPSSPLPTTLKKATQEIIPKEAKTKKETKKTGKQLPLKLRISDAFPSQQGRIPNNPLLAAGLAAIWKGGEKVLTLMGGWLGNEAGCPVYHHNGRRGGKIIVYPNLKRNSNDGLPTTEHLWQFTKSLSPFTADVALAVLAQLCEPSVGDRPKYPLLESVRITADAILRYKGIQRWGIERRMLKERVFEEMEKLRALYFDVEKVPAWDPATNKWNGKGFSWRGDRLFDIVKVEQYHENISGERTQIEFSWLVRAGQWAYWWLNAQGRIWIGRMARILLELDHQGAALAKKIGQRVVLLNEALQPDVPLCLRVDHLLEDLGELPAPENRGRNWSGRTRERFDNAMLNLEKIGIFQKVEWPDGFGPEDTERSRGWTKNWLSARVKITLPDRPPELSENFKVRKLTQKKETKAIKAPQNTITPAALDYTPFHGKQIRELRKGKGWSQKALAQYLGVSSSYLSQIENNKQSPSEKLQKKFSDWMEENHS